jgi:hypothetical protein
MNWLKTVILPAVLSYRFCLYRISSLLVFGLSPFYTPIPPSIMVQTAAQPKKGKAGGNGKKGKKFVEDKVCPFCSISALYWPQLSQSALLSLIDALPKVQKESAAEDALSAKGKSKSVAGEDEPVYAAGRAIDAAELDRPARDSGWKGRKTDEGKTESKNRQRTKAKNRALVRDRLLSVVNAVRWSNPLSP